MPMWITDNMKVLYYDRIDVSEGNDFNKTIKPRVQYQYFLNFNQMSAVDAVI